MSNGEVFGYFQRYGDHFQLTRRIRFKHEVLLITPAADYNEKGRWNVLVRDLTSDKELLDTYDAVLVCAGRHVYPNVPTFVGQEKFKGTIMHTHSIKVPDQFTDRRVTVVGVGNSGVDTVVDVSNVASQVSKASRA